MQYLDELLRREGLCEALSNSNCVNCNAEEARFRCLDCICARLQCETCMLSRHSMLPLHRIQVYNEHYFERISLTDMGLVVQLGHGGDMCANPIAGPKDFLVCDITGMHSVCIQYCHCYREAENGVLPRWVQLMRAGWLPATSQYPRTAFTFHVLDTFENLTLQGKTNQYDFYKALERITDSTGLVDEHGRYHQFTEVVRIWEHLQLLKRNARAHIPNGISTITEGSLAMDCAACPQPEKNLPEDWTNAPADRMWLYVLFLMLDANFRMRCKDRGLEDQSLSPGWAYVVENNKYIAHMEKFATEDEVNTCSAEHNAIVKANMRKQGYVASGVGAVLCGRHGLARKNGVGDLQKGEKFCNMDYLLLSTLMGIYILYLLISYDIACQYRKKFKQRMLHYPSSLHLNMDQVKIRWAVPKNHIGVHGPNHAHLSFNFIPKVGRTYGEGIESAWAHMNPVSGSTSEMGSARRHEVIDNHWHAWNWQKTIGFRTHFAKALQIAYQQFDKQKIVYQELSATFPEATIQSWSDHINRWFDNPNLKPNPFEETLSNVTLSEVKLQLAKEEISQSTRGVMPIQNMTQATFIQVGLELEDEQSSLIVKCGTNKSSSLDEQTHIQQKRNTLYHRIQTWRNTQNIYMSFVPILRSETEPSAEDALEIVPAEELRLYLPSSFQIYSNSTSGSPSLAYLELPYFKSLMEIERRLRIAQLNDTLDEIRRYRRLLTRVTQFKTMNVSGTGNKPNTRIRTLYGKYQGRINLAAKRYHMAYAAMQNLDPQGEWSKQFQYLHDKDISGPGRDNDSDPSEGRYVLSWIWRTATTQARSTSAEAQASQAEYDESMRVDWAKAKARMERWEEEIELLHEEMRRVVAYFQWKANWWDQQKSLRLGDGTPELQAGLNAYALRQADMFSLLAERMVSTWYHLVTRDELKTKWKEDYPDIAVPDMMHESDEEEGTMAQAEEMEAEVD
ncbi:hypothetical protein K474DRAFT_1722408 [Panus rudis PR-1116 ss-1]|nr:hypothetical protein K474DRAFT_1722408 [Panus rudis PR-1116 ss-1]